MRKLFAAVVLAGLMTSLVLGQAKKQDPTKKAPVTLKVGDAAPALKATKWLQGDEVKSFEPGKVYVVEFWATWCGPCIVMMPHLSELQAEYKNKGVTFIGFSPMDKSNTEAKVTEFVKKRGPKLKYTFAFDEEQDTRAAWMRAAGQNGIPCCFVVDKAGKIAYIGHPMFLDPILPKVVEGSWKSANAAAEVEKVKGVYTAAAKALSGADAEEAMKTWNGYESKNPWIASVPYITATRLGTMLKAGQTADVQKVAEKLMKKGVDFEDPGSLQTVSMALRSPAAKGNKELLAISLKAATSLLELQGEKNPLALINMAEACYANGDKVKGAEYGKRAIAAAPTAQTKALYEKRLKQYENDQ